VGEAVFGTLGVAILIAVAVGGVAYVFIYPLLSGERRVEQRMRDVSTMEADAHRSRKSADPTAKRRQQVEDSLQQIEDRRKRSSRPPLSVRLQQSGLTWTKRQFWITNVIAGLFAAIVAWIFGASILIALGVGFSAGIGLPRWMLSFLKKRRETRFLEEFPNGIDIIVRGVKSGLPVGDCIRIVAAEAREPVKAEFRMIAESQAIGIPLADATARLFEHIPLPEANFFGIVVSIQQKSGGSLSEALANLSRVLRERRKMQAKIKAMSMEAKASAAIIAALPIAVMLLVYLTSPNYIEMLWTTPLGRTMLFCSGVWMSMGVFVMRRMINFDF
jgi:tight adherence protein B